MPFAAAPVARAGLRCREDSSAGLESHHSPRVRASLSGFACHLPLTCGCSWVVGGIHIDGSPWPSSVSLDDGVLCRLPEVR